MSNHIRSVYLKVPAEEAERIWAKSSPRIRGLVFGIQSPVQLHFIPAEGGCVVAAVPAMLQETEQPRLKRLLQHFISKSAERRVDAVVQSLPALVEDSQS